MKVLIERKRGRARKKEIYMLWFIFQTAILVRMGMTETRRSVLALLLCRMAVTRTQSDNWKVKRKEWIQVVTMGN